MKTGCFKNCFAAVSFALTTLAVTGGEDLARWVDPFVGTGATGHTFPAACVPFGLVQAGPDTGNGNWDYCSGYRHGDKTICGFTQTHLNGTGCPDLGDVRILPFCSTGLADCKNPVNLVNPVKKISEVAEPGYCAVTLDGGIKVEIAAAEHSAIYRITGNGRLRLLVDCAYGIGGKDFAKTITASDARLIGKSGLSGKNHRRQWVERDYSFVVKFDREFAAAEELPKREGVAAPQYVFDFDLDAVAQKSSPSGCLLVKVALSAEGGVEAAERNLSAEIADWDFDAVKNAARAKWNEVLSRATIEGTGDQKKNWYTSLYHLFIQPNNIADAGAKPFYSTLSTWDTFRAAHPLYTILTPKKAAEFVDSMLEQGRRTGYLPIWTLWGKDNQCMIGTHSVPVIVDWFLKEVGENRMSWRSNSYWLSAYAQIKDALTKPHKGRIKERWDLLDKYGYYPFDEIKGESVSRTLECAYDDWCAGVMAEKLGFADDAAFFFRRSESWRNVFDASIGLVRGKDSNGKWREPYNPYTLGHGADIANDFTEGNAFQYTWHIMQNPRGLVDAMGGRDAFVKKLDSLFEAPSNTEGMGEVLDVTGLIGQYVHGNEPSHHVIYFYPQVGHPEKAAERIREVFDKFYLPKPDGLCGNDDCGQMSAWYIFSAMGFYPFNPCGGEYILGAPQIACAKLRVEGGEFRVVARHLSKENKYVKSVTLNGMPVTDWKIRHTDIMSGGELVFEMHSGDKACHAMPLLGVDQVSWEGMPCERMGWRRPYKEHNIASYSSRKEWEDETIARLKSWGFNMLGACCDPSLRHRGLAHAVFLNMSETFCTGDEDRWISEYRCVPNTAMPNVFHPDYAAHCDKVAREMCAASRDDADLLGYYIDNELVWQGMRGAPLDDGLFDAIRGKRDGHSARRALMDFMKGYGVADLSTFDALPHKRKKSVKAAFLDLVAERYFRITTDAIRRHDPNHLVMGCRFAGLDGAPTAVWKAAGRFCDVVTFNCYPWADLDRNVVLDAKGGVPILSRFAKIHELVEKPLFITEWSFPALDTGRPCRNGAGQRFSTQAERVAASELFARTMLSQPYVFGYSFFMWIDQPALGTNGDNPEDSNYGLVSENGVPYAGLTKMFAQLHKEICGTGKRPAAPVERLPPQRREQSTGDIFRSEANGMASDVSFVQDGDAWTLSNSSGLTLCGRVGGGTMIDDVRVGSRIYGRYGGMIQLIAMDGAPHWVLADPVKSVRHERAGVCDSVLIVASGCAGEHSFDLVHRITVAPGRTDFLCEVVEISNTGRSTFSVRRFYLCPFAAEESPSVRKGVPNMWKGVRECHWVMSDGRSYGMVSSDEAAEWFNLWVDGDGRQHPDIDFVPETAVVLAPGESYSPSTPMGARGVVRDE